MKDILKNMSSAKVFVILGFITMITAIVILGFFFYKNSATTSNMMAEQEDVIVDLKKRLDQTIEKTKENIEHVKNSSEKENEIYSELDIIGAKIQTRADISPVQINQIINRIHEMQESVKELQSLLISSGNVVNKNLPENNLPNFESCASDSDSDEEYIPKTKSRRNKMTDKSGDERAMKRRSRHDN